MFKITKVNENVQRLESADVFTNNLSTSARQLFYDFKEIAYLNFMFSSNLPQNPIGMSEKAAQRHSIIEQAGGKSALGQTRKLLNQYKQTLSLTDKQKTIGLGILLGDGSLQTQNKGQTYRLKYEGSDKHRQKAEHIPTSRI